MRHNYSYEDYYKVPAELIRRGQYKIIFYRVINCKSDFYLNCGKYKVSACIRQYCFKPLINVFLFKL